MLILNKNILTIGGNRLEGGPLTPPTPPGPSFDEVTIGTQTWMAKNLAIDDSGEGIESVNVGVVNGVDLGTQYYYTWDAAVRVANSITGWHLPSKEEFETLITYAGGIYLVARKLKSTSGWNDNGNGTDDYGFTALPCGRKWNNSVINVGDVCCLWTNTLDNNNKAYYLFMNKYDFAEINVYSNTDGYPIRLIKDT